MKGQKLKLHFCPHCKGFLCIPKGYPYYGRYYICNNVKCPKYKYVKKKDDFKKEQGK